MTVKRSRTQPRRHRRSRGDSDGRLAPDIVRENREWYRLIVNSVRDFAIFATDTDGRINSWNPGAERFFGYSSKEICGKPMDLLYTPEDRAANVAHKERATAAEKGTSEDERWHLRKDGTRFFVFGRVNPMYTDGGELCGFIKIARDITARKDLQTRLDASEELQRMVLQNLPDFAVLTLDTTGRIETWNTGAEITYGYPASEIVGKNIEILYTPSDRATGAPKKVLAAAARNEQATEEHWCIRKDGRRIFVIGILRPISDDLGAVRGFSKVARDITARRELQEELERSHDYLEKLVAQRTASLSEAVNELETFSYSLTHDMRGPLRAMQGFAEVLLLKYAALVPEDAQDLLKRIAAAAQRLDHMIKESLAYYRTPREPLPVQPTELEQVIRTFSSENPDLATGETLEVQRPLLTVMAHPPSLMQALSNVLTNAYRFVPSNRKPKVRLWTERVDDQIRIYVQDNGIGIAPADQQKIWNLFARLHPEEFEGTGIGLALVRKVTERMGGSVGVESEEGKGSKFWLQLPAPQDS